MIDNSFKTEKLSKENIEKLEEYQKYYLKNSVKDNFFKGTQKVTINDWFINMVILNMIFKQKTAKSIKNYLVLKTTRQTRF